MTDKRTIILGISCFYHDAAAALLIDGRIVAAAQEERFTRKKHDESFPEHAVMYCLSSQSITIEDVDYVVFYDKPIAKFERLLQTFIKKWPLGLKLFIMAMRTWLTEKLWIEHTITKKLNWKKEVLFTEHHYAHAASAFYCSPFDEAAVVTMDGVGEWETLTLGKGEGSRLELTQSIVFPDSLGLLYSAVTYYLGFKVNSAEYKVMGLAPYGNPEPFYGTFKKLMEVREDGSFKLNMRYFAYEYGMTMTNWRFNTLFGAPPRNPSAPLEQRHKDIAAALQKITEELVLGVVRHAKKMYPSKNLCLAGGVALNCVANGKIMESGLFDDIYIQPAAGDAGGAVGAACYLYFAVLKNPKSGSAMEGAYLGPEYSDADIVRFLKEKHGLAFSRLPDDTLYGQVAKLIADNNVVGWFQGRMEFGPRALGNRSILADARNKENWQKVNLKIKYRESFRPFAPAVLEEKAEEYFALKGHKSPYMLLVAPVIQSSIPAVTHVDNSARIQTVSKKQNERFYELIREFYRQTGCPVVINTSFNVRSEPIVCTPHDAYHCFVNTEMDYLVLGNYLIGKKENSQLEKERETSKYINTFELD
ncbi:MAG TPA: carbamoyltransferase [Candidatus Paceibacterota bacterium]